MKIRLVLVALAVVASPALAFAACMGDHAKEEITMSCAPGTVYDTDAQACVPSTS